MLLPDSKHALRSGWCLSNKRLFELWTTSTTLTTDRERRKEPGIVLRTLLHFEEGLFLEHWHMLWVEWSWIPLP